MTRSALGFTVVVVVAKLFAELVSVVLLDTRAVFEMVVPSGIEAVTLTTRVNVPDVFGVIVALEHEIIPVPPTAGVVQVNPAGLASETKVVLVGTVSVITTLATLLGPELVTIIV